MKKENKLIQLAHIGTGGQKGRIYSIRGISPTIVASCYKGPLKFVYYKGKQK